MFRIKQHRSPDAENAQSGGSGIVYDEAWADEIDRKLDSGEMEDFASDEEYSAYTRIREGEDSDSADNKPEPEQDTLGDEGKQEQEGEEALATDKADISEDAFKEAMKAVGAKDEKEYHQKVLELHRKLGTQGSELGTQLKQYKTLAEQREQTQTQLVRLVNDLAKGDRTAWEHVKKENPNLVLHPSLQKLFEEGKQSQEAETDEVPEGVLDEQTYRALSKKLDPVMKELADLRQFKETFSQRQAEAEQARMQREASETWAKQVTDLVMENPDLMPTAKDGDGLNVGKARSLIQSYYFGNPTEKELEEFANVENFLRYVADNQLHHSKLELRTIYNIKRAENLKAIEAQAEERGKQAVLSRPTSVGLGKVRNQGSQGGQVKTYSDSDFMKMLNGQMDVPDELIDEDGWFIPEKVPESVRQHFIMN